MSARNATTIVKLFISSRAQVLVMEAPVRFGTTEASTTVLRPQMHMAGCEMVTATLRRPLLEYLPINGGCLSLRLSDTETIA